MLVKNQIKVDDLTFPFAEVKGYMQNKVYYAKKGNDFIQRIVHGKINVYVQFTEVTETSTGTSGMMTTSSHTRTGHCAQYLNSIFDVYNNGCKP